MDVAALKSDTIGKRVALRVVSIVVATGCVLPVRAICFGQITLDQDFDSGSLNVAGSSIDYGDPNSPLITLALRNTVRRVHPRTHFRATGVQGLRPNFRVTVQGQPEGHRHVYSYDYENWYFFDNGEEGSTWATFSDDTPFTEDTIYVAHVLPYPMWRTDEFVDSIRSNPWVSPTASGDANLVVGRTLGTAGGGYYDDTGRIVPAQNLYGFRITDSSEPGPKTKVVVSGGNHPAENTGTCAVEGLIDFLISNDPRAARLRRYADFYVYPQVNPEGKHAGYHRSNPEHPDRDHNRYWNHPEMLTDLMTIEAAMKTDTGGNTDFFFDFHSFGSASQIGQLWMRADMFETDLALAVPTYEPDITPYEWFMEQAAPGWATSPDPNGLDAEFVYTPEIGVVVGVLDDRYRQVGMNYGLALCEIIGPDLITGDASGDGYVDDDDLSLLLSHWGMQTGRVNGNFDGDDFVEDDDRNLLLANWHIGTPPGEQGTLIPEPATGSFLLLCALGLIRRGGRFFPLQASA